MEIDSKFNSFLNIVSKLKDKLKLREKQFRSPVKINGNLIRSCAGYNE